MISCSTFVLFYYLIYQCVKYTVVYLYTVLLMDIGVFSGFCCSGESCLITVTPYARVQEIPLGRSGIAGSEGVGMFNLKK